MAYLGRQPNTGVRSRYIYTATASQTTFSGSDDDGKTLKYEDAAYLDVFLNGVLLKPVTDYTTTTKTSVVLTSGAAASDVVEIVAYDIANIADTVSKANGGTFEADVTVQGTVTSTGSTVNGNLSVDNGTIKLDGNYPTGTGNVALGNAALDDGSLSGNQNVAIGSSALTANTSGTGNIGIGDSAGGSNTTGSSNTAVGNAALLFNTTASFNTSVGEVSGFNSTGGYNTFLGYGAGYHVSSGSKNTVLGMYNGNQGGLDIRASSNNIVLSDGDGNPRVIVDQNGNMRVPASYNNTTAASANAVIESSGSFARSTSSLRYKNSIADATHGLTELLTLRPVTYKGNNDGDTVFGGLIAEEVHDAGLTEFVTYDEQNRPDALAYSNMVSLCIKAIQELSEKNDALEARITALENA